MLDASSDTVIITSFIANLLAILVGLSTIIKSFINRSRLDKFRNSEQITDSYNDKFELNEIQNEDDKIQKVIEVLTGRIRKQRAISLFLFSFVVLVTAYLVFFQYNQDSYLYKKKSFLFDKTTPFNKIRDELKVLIVPFQKPLNKANDVEYFLKNRFIELREEEGLNITTKLLNYKPVVSFPEAKMVGKEYNADIVLFGKYDSDKKLQLSYVVVDKVLAAEKSKGRTEFKQISGESDISQGYLQEDIDEIIYWALGIRSLRKNDYSKALSYFNAVEITQNSPFKTKLEKAKLLCNTKLELSFSTEQYYKYAIEQNFVEFSYFELAYFASEYCNDPELTINIYNDELTVSESASSLNNIANSYFKNNQFDQAEEAYLKAIKLNPQSLFVENLSLLYKHEHFKKYDKSEEILLKAIESDSLNTSLYNTLGLLYLKEHFNDIIKARENFNKAIRINQNYLEPHFNLAYIENVYNNNHRKAIQYLDRALKIAPNDASVYYELGEHYQFYKKNYHKAENYYIKSIEIDGTYANAYSRLGDLYRDNYKLYTKSEENYRIAISIDPEESIFYNKMGILLLDHMKKNDEALSYFREALSKRNLTSEDKSIYLANCGLTYQRKNDLAKAEEYYLEALTHDDDYVFVNIQLFNLYDELGKYKLAEKHYKKAYETDDSKKSVVYILSLKLKQLFS